MIDLRDYQIASIEGLREGIRSGHRSQVLVAPTGAGKTVMAAYLLQEVQRKGTKAGFIVDRVALCNQTSAMLWHYNIDHGVAQSSNTFGQHEKIQVCSAQTLEKRGRIAADWDILLVDECHTMRRFILDYVQTTKAKVVGLTATPFSKGMSKIYTNLVNVTTTNKLIHDGFLAPLKVYVAVAADMTGAKTDFRGEWQSGEVERRGKQIIGDIVNEWIDKTGKHFGGPVKTIAFSATVDHGEEICKQFQAAGFNFQQVSYKDGNDERRAKLIEEFRLEESDIVGLVSCEALAKGFDVPDIRAMILARPYRKSFASHIQQIGRGMRSFPGKDYCLALDHAGNYLGFLPETENLFEHGVHAFDDGELQNTVRRETDKSKSEFACSICGYVFPPTLRACPSCGAERPLKTRVESQPGRMVAIGEQAKKPRVPEYLDRDRKDVWQEICYVAAMRKPGDLDAAVRFAKAQYRNFYNLWPPFEFRPAMSCDYRLESHIKANLIRYIKGRSKRR